MRLVGFLYALAMRWRRYAYTTGIFAKFSRNDLVQAVE